MIELFFNPLMYDQTAGIYTYNAGFFRSPILIVQRDEHRVPHYFHRTISIQRYT